MHEPAVVLTDLLLAALGAWLASRLTGRGRIILAALASAAFWGALFHAFFPGRTATAAGYVAWLPVAFSIMMVAAALLDMTAGILVPRVSTRLRRIVIAGYCIAFAGVVLLIDESFSMLVRLYGPILLLALCAAAFAALRRRSGPWALVAAGLALSAGAALLQQARVALHPVYFDHNAVYHVVQAAALVVLYLGFHERRTDHAARA